MRYETIFRRLDERFQAETGKRRPLLTRCVAAVTAVREEIFSPPNPPAVGSFRITMREQLVFDRFAEIELEHCGRDGWHTRAVGYLDTQRRWRTLFVSRCDTLGEFEPHQVNVNFHLPDLIDDGTRKIGGMLSSQRDEWAADAIPA